MDTLRVVVVHCMHNIVGFGMYLNLSKFDEQTSKRRTSKLITFIPTNSYELVVEYARCMHTSVVGSMHTTLVSFNIIISSFPYFYMFLRARTRIRAYVNY